METPLHRDRPRGTALIANGLDALVRSATVEALERCEHRIDLWGAAAPGVDAPQSEVDAVLRSIETLIRQPGTGPDKVRELRRWAATKIAPSGDGAPPDVRLLLQPHDQKRKHGKQADGGHRRD